MRNQQIQKYAALISKYQNRKKSSRMTANHHHTQISNFSQTIDPTLFRQVIQEKIRNKYLEPKIIKSPPQPASHSMHLQSLSKIPQRRQKTDESFKEENQKPQNVRQNDNSLLKVNNLTIIKNKTPVFINTSNLLTLGSPTCIKNRKQTQQMKRSVFEHSKHQLNMFRAEGTSQTLKRSLERGQKLQKITKYGYELDGSIFHFEQPNSKTLPSDFEQIKEKDINSVKVDKQRIYKVLKSTSPLVVTPKILKNNLNSTKTTMKDQGLLTAPQKFLRKKKMLKSESQRVQNKQYDYHFKPGSMYFRQLSKEPSPKKQESITAWDYEQQF